MEKGEGEHAYEKEMSSFEHSGVEFNMHMKRRFPHLNRVGLGSTCIYQGQFLI